VDRLAALARSWAVVGPALALAGLALVQPLPADWDGVHVGQIIVQPRQTPRQVDRFRNARSGY
jgi:hypothetical protein